jgi:hypothetical protein
MSREISKYLVAEPDGKDESATGDQYNGPFAETYCLVTLAAGSAIL